MYRMSFRRGQKYASINMVPGGAGDVIVSRHKGKKVPCTVNVCPPVGPELVSVSTMNPVIFPGQTDKLGLAGAIQGFPVDVVKAKTVDSYAIAQSEWTLEGYVLEGERVWETEEAEKLGKQGVALLHPEWARTMGHAYRTPRAFELTCVTRRTHNPIVYTPHFGAFWYEAPFMCAAVYELCERMAPASCRTSRRGSASRCGAGSSSRSRRPSAPTKACSATSSAPSWGCSAACGW
jgi:4-hydroxy-3-polyprenylbenzoate decarboxylase